MLNQKGMATIEMVPILMLFVLLVNFTLGFFGIIHSGILNSIAARNYTFETFRNRANLNYLRDEPSSDPIPYYTTMGFRYHSIVGDGTDKQNQWVATKRVIKFSELSDQGVEARGNSNDHNKTVRTMADESKKTSTYFPGKTRQDEDVGVDPVWIMTTYGICLNPTCGGGT